LGERKGKENSQTLEGDGATQGGCRERERRKDGKDLIQIVKISGGGKKKEGRIRTDLNPCADRLQLIRSRGRSIRHE